MNQVNRIFLGETHKEPRLFLLEALKKLVPYFDTVIIPMAGNFVIPKVAIAAGFKPSQVQASDISAYSSILGNLYSGKPLSSLPLSISPAYADEYDALPNDVERAAFLFWLMKCEQIPGKSFYDKQFKEHFIDNGARYRKFFIDTFPGAKAVYQGMDYQIRDVRDIVHDADDPKALIIINPPAYSRGYEKMFAFDSIFTWDSGVEGFEGKKEYPLLYDESRGKASTFIWARHSTVDSTLSRDAIYAKEYSIERVVYWLSPSHEDLKAKGVVPRVDFKKRPEYRPVHGVSLVKTNYEITPNTRVSFMVTKKEHGLYYRDLFAHKLGHTNAEIYVLMLLDGHVFGTVGLHTSDLRTMKNDKVFECFGFSMPLKKFPTANRLLMMCITCRQFRDFILSSAIKTNRVYDLNGLKTTCLAKYRKAKQNNNLLNVVARDKLPDGSYRIVYETLWHDRDFSQCVRDYLAELAAQKKGVKHVEDEG